jgi:5'-3' exonuclease
MRPYGSSFAMRPTHRLLRALAAAAWQRPRRGLPRKLRKQPVEPAGRSEAKPAQLASLSLRAARCWSSTATPSPIDPTTRCRKLFAAAMATLRTILGSANFLLRFYADEQPRAVIVGWDSLDAPTKRHEMFPTYQSGREFDEELIEQLHVLPEFVAAFGFTNAKAPGFEADDFLAAAVAAEEGAGGTVIVASGDRDSFQLASLRTTILYPSRGGELARIGPEEVRQRYGVDPKQVPDFIALRGDPSDIARRCRSRAKTRRAIIATLRHA